MTDSVTLTADACPHRKQNVDYAEYLMTALFMESCKREPWEDAREDGGGDGRMPGLPIGTL